MKKSIALRLAMVAVVVAGGLGFFSLMGAESRLPRVPDYRIYEGRVYLSNTEYAEFKRFLADNPNIDIQEMTSLSSDNPLLDFKLRVNGDQVIPYGENTFTHRVYTLEASGRADRYRGLMVAVVLVTALVAVFLLEFASSVAKEERK